MIQLSELKAVEDVFFRIGLKYNKSSLYPFIEKNFSEDKFFDEESQKKILKILENSKDNLAHNVLLNMDISRINEHVKQCKFDDKFWIEKLPQIRQKIQKHLKMKFKVRDICFCDSFPDQYKNYEVRGASTITIFENQKNPGIHFLNKRIDNTSTGIHIIHEEIHTCLSQNKNKDQMFMEWFEEGLAIIYSIIIYYELSKDIDTLNAYRTRSYIFSKVKPEWDYTKRYFEYMKIISRIFLQGGIELLDNLKVEYLKGNREKINSYLRNIRNNTLNIKYTPKNEIENFIATFSNILEPEQITPLEYVIVECIKKKPKSIEQISKEINAPIDVTKNALNRLFVKGICIVVKDNKIDIIWRKKDLFNEELIKPMFPIC